MKNQRLDAEDELSWLLALMTLFGMSAGAVHQDQSRAMSAGIDLAISSVIDLLNKLRDMRIDEAA